jgi:hypothetical protein
MYLFPPFAESGTREPRVWGSAPPSSHCLREHASPRVRDPHPRDLDRAPSRYHALGLRACQSSPHQFDYLLSREAFGAVTAGGEQFEREPIGCEFLVRNTASFVKYY